jgi:uncharacterized membrane protein (UPF0136 family)
MTDPTYAVTVAEALRSLLGGMLFGLVVFVITFLIMRNKTITIITIRRKHERP